MITFTFVFVTFRKFLLKIDILTKGFKTHLDSLDPKWVDFTLRTKFTQRDSCQKFCEKLFVRFEDWSCHQQNVTVICLFRFSSVLMSYCLKIHDKLRLLLPSKNLFFFSSVFISTGYPTKNLKLETVYSVTPCIGFNLQNWGKFATRQLEEFQSHFFFLSLLSKGKVCA